MVAPGVDARTLNPNYRRVIEAEVAIESPIEAVWKVMVDPDGYPSWNPFVVKVDAPNGITIGAELVIFARMPFGITKTRERVVTFDPPSGGAAGFAYRLQGLLDRTGLVTATRWQGLETLGPSRTRYVTREAFGGYGWRLLPFAAVERGFQAHAEALRTRCEQHGGA